MILLQVMCFPGEFCICWLGSTEAVYCHNILCIYFLLREWRLLAEVTWMFRYCLSCIREFSCACSQSVEIIIVGPPLSLQFCVWRSVFLVRVTDFCAWTHFSWWHAIKRSSCVYPLVCEVEVVFHWFCMHSVSNMCETSIHCSKVVGLRWLTSWYWSPLITLCTYFFVRLCFNVYIYILSSGQCARVCGACDTSMVLINEV